MKAKTNGQPLALAENTSIGDINQQSVSPPLMDNEIMTPSFQPKQHENAGSKKYSPSNTPELPNRKQNKTIIVPKSDFIKFNPNSNKD